MYHGTNPRTLLADSETLHLTEIARTRTHISQRITIIPQDRQGTLAQTGQILICAQTVLLQVYLTTPLDIMICNKLGAVLSAAASAFRSKNLLILENMQLLRIMRIV